VHFKPQSLCETPKCLTHEAWANDDVFNHNWHWHATGWKRSWQIWTCLSWWKPSQHKRKEKKNWGTCFVFFKPLNAYISPLWESNVEWCHQILGDFCRRWSVDCDSFFWFTPGSNLKLVDKKRALQEDLCTTFCLTLLSYDMVNRLCCQFSLCVETQFLLPNEICLMGMWLQMTHQF